MTVKEQIRQDMQKAAKERDSLALSSLRMALSAIHNREIEARGELADEEVVRLLGTLIKQRREAIELYRKGDRPELAEKEAREIEVLSRYLPPALSAGEIEALAAEAVRETGAAGPADLGRVMKELMPKVAGRADGKAVREVVQRLLAG
ncbi:MAG: GatB/YqeY domain-containing protein [Deltaproteobacteria bacterium]